MPFNAWENKMLFLAPLEMLLLAAVISLFIVAFIAATTFTKGASSMTALKEYLSELQALLKNHTHLDAEAERSTLEKLINQVKVSSTEMAIAKNKALEEILQSTCENIQLTMESKKVGQRSAWQQLKDTAIGFNQQYFAQAVV